MSEWWQEAGWARRVTGAREDDFTTGVIKEDVKMS